MQTAFTFRKKNFSQNLSKQRSDTNIRTNMVKALTAGTVIAIAVGGGIGLYFAIDAIIETTKDDPKPTPSTGRFNSVYLNTDFVDYKNFNYKHLDAVIGWGDIDQDFVEYVNSKETEVHRAVGLEGFDVTELVNENVTDIIVEKYVNFMEKYNLGGINLDFEGSTHKPETKIAYVNFLKKAKKAINAIETKYYPYHGLFTHAVPWSPAAVDCLDGRCYPVLEMAQDDVLDYMIIMGYDAEEDWWGANTWGHSTGAYYRIKQGLKEYIECLNVEPRKLTLALPWYNWAWECDAPADQPDQSKRPKGRSNQCQHARFNDNNHHIDFKDSLDYFYDYENRVDSVGNSMAEEAKNGHYYFSSVENSYFFHWKDPEGESGPDSGSIWEIWLDALPGNLTAAEDKYKLMADNGLAGLGLWTATNLPYDSKNSDLQKYNQEMWDLYDDYNSKVDVKNESQFDYDYWNVALCRKYHDRTPRYLM